MLKEKYIRAELEFLQFHTKDVITTSEYDGWNPNDGGNGGDNYEGWNPYDPGAGGYEGWNP